MPVPAYQPRPLPNVTVLPKSRPISLRFSPDEYGNIAHLTPEEEAESRRQLKQEPPTKRLACNCSTTRSTRVPSSHSKGQQRRSTEGSILLGFVLPQWLGRVRRRSCSRQVVSESGGAGRARCPVQPWWLLLRWQRRHEGRGQSRAVVSESGGAGTCRSAIHAWPLPAPLFYPRRRQGHG